MFDKTIFFCYYNKNIKVGINMTKNNKLNDTLIKVLRVIKIHLTEYGYPPTVRELMDDLGVKSTSTIAYYLNKLEEMGKIKRSLNKNRAIELIPESYEKQTQKQVTRIPLIGEVAAGKPILAVENFEDVYEIPQGLFKGSDLFMLTIKGESMINAGIYDGDKIIVKKQNYAENTEIVVAMINGSATVKRFYKEENHIRLQPENDTMKPIYCFNVEILGKVVGLIRNYK